MHEIGGYSKGGPAAVHSSLPNIFSEFGFRHKSDFNEHILKWPVMNAKEVHPEEAQRNYQFDSEENLDSISAVFYRQMREDQARRDAARGEFAVYP